MCVCLPGRYSISICLSVGHRAAGFSVLHVRSWRQPTVASVLAPIRSTCTLSAPPGSVYVTFIIAAAAEFPANVLAAWMIEKYGRWVATRRPAAIWQHPSLVLP